VLQGCLLFFGSLLGISLFMAFAYLPEKLKQTPYVISSEKDSCFARSETVCDSPAITKFYMWNLTNPREVAAGLAPPALQEVGPYVLYKQKEKRSNITFYDNNTKVSYVSVGYGEWDYASFGANLTLNDTIVSFNPAYYTLVKAFGSEKNFLFTLLPRVLPGVIKGIVAVFRVLAAMPTMAAALPHIKAAADAGDAALDALALQQWGDCSVLGGQSVIAVGLPPAALAMFPAVPEFGAFAATAAGLSSTSILGLSTTAAQTVVAELTADVSGTAILELLQWPPTSLAAKLNVTATQAGLLKAYIVHVSMSYGKGGMDAIHVLPKQSSSPVYTCTWRTSSTCARPLHQLKPQRNICNDPWYPGRSTLHRMNHHDEQQRIFVMTLFSDKSFCSKIFSPHDE
jgi:hypothetical protein